MCLSWLFGESEKPDDDYVHQDDEEKPTGYDSRWNRTGYDSDFERFVSMND